MADQIQMPFGVVSGVGVGMGVLDFGGDHRRGRGSLGVNLRYVCMSVSLSGKCNVAKRLIRSGCCLGW